MYLTTLITVACTAAFGAMLVLIMIRWLGREYRQVGSELILKYGKLVEVAALSYSKRQLITTAYAVVTAAIFAFMLKRVDFSTTYTPFAIITGASFSSGIGYLGMIVAVIANPVVSWLSARGVHHAKAASFVGGCIVGFAALTALLIDLGGWYAIIIYTNPGMESAELSKLIADTMITFAFGSSLVAFIARVAGGNFTKSADSAADKIGKGDYELEEDDPRNPAVIADNAGDAANDIGAMSNDMFESAAGSSVGAIEAGANIHGVPKVVVPAPVDAGATDGVSGIETGAHAAVVISALGYASLTPEQLIGLPLFILCIGLFSSALAAAWYLFLAPKGESITDLFNAGRNMILIAAGLVTLAYAVLIYYFFNAEWRLFWAVPMAYFASFLAAVVIINRSTGGDSKSVKELAESAEEGTAAVILGGLRIGKLGAFQATVLIAGAVYLIYWASGGMINPAYGVYGTGLGAVAVLAITPIILALDAQGATSDMAQGNLTMSGVNGVRLEAMNKMDSLGNTMAAMVKGIAIISGVLTAIVLAYAFRAAINKALLQFGLNTEIDYSMFNISVLTGILLGAASPHLFTAKFFRSVPATTKVMMDEIKRQIRDLGIFRGENEPDYAKCVDIATRAAQKNAIGPAIYAVGIPITIGIVLGPAGILAYLLSALASGFIEAIVMSNAGGAWDNAKKLFEARPNRDKHSTIYKSLIEGDVVGDTTKDVAGPSQNILIKLQITVSIFTAPLQVYLHYQLMSLFT